MQSNNKLVVRKGLDPWLCSSVDTTGSLDSGFGGRLGSGFILPKPIEILKVAVDFFTGSEGLSPYAGTFWPNFVQVLFACCWDFSWQQDSDWCWGFTPVSTR